MGKHRAFAKSAENNSRAVWVLLAALWHVVRRCGGSRTALTSLVMLPGRGLSKNRKAPALRKEGEKKQLSRVGASGGAAATQVMVLVDCWRCQWTGGSAGTLVMVLLDSWWCCWTNSGASGLVVVLVDW